MNKRVVSESDKGTQSVCYLVVCHLFSVHVYNNIIKFWYNNKLPPDTFYNLNEKMRPKLTDEAYSKQLEYA